MNAPKSLNVQVIELIETAIELHKIKNYESCSKICELSEQIAEILETNSQPNKAADLSRNFTDGWADSCNHNWLYYEGINQNAWPVLALEIISCIKGKKEIKNSILI